MHQSQFNIQTTRVHYSKLRIVENLHHFLAGQAGIFREDKWETWIGIVDAFFPYKIYFFIFSQFGDSWIPVATG